MDVWVAFSLGLLGSLHCAGMCGPIALALPLGNKSTWQKWLGVSSYSLGRIATYALIGLLFGLFGKGLALAGWQQWVSIATGAVLVMSIVLPNHLLHRFSITAPIARWTGGLKKQMLRFMQADKPFTLFTFGLLNGLLPCGLVYLAVMGSLAAGTALNGALFMALFGLGTAPMLMGVALAGQLISGQLRMRFRKVVPVAVVLIGFLFILRGLGLGIPYLSPPNGALQVEATASCCSPDEHASGEASSCH
jgi:sulfite exporter TauE/SafE